MGKISKKIGRTRDDVPLYVDMDGTLLKTDSLLEYFFAALKQRGITLIAGTVGALFRGGRAGLKRFLTDLAILDTKTWPLNEEFVKFLHEEKQNGREIWLATAADRKIAEDVADHIGTFDGILASDGITNLKGRRKLKAIQETSGGNPFDYAGNDMPDLPIWHEARSALVVNATPFVRSRIRSLKNIGQVFESRGFGLADLLTAMRPYQWVKNALVFIPILTSSHLSVSSKWISSVGAFACFCLIASGTYILNDLFDLEADRQHPRKKHRPMANGAVPLLRATAMSAGLIIGGLLLATTVNTVFLFTISCYLLLTVTYSAVIKSYVIGDVIALAALYTLRLLGGSAAINEFPSVWLIAFSMFVFFSLALIKRCAELEMLTLKKQESSSGRDYRVIDVSVLYSLGISFGAVGILVFALYVADPLVASRFSTPIVLWLIAPCLIYWMARLWIKTARGEMHDDPIVFTLRDRGTRLLLAIAGAFFLIAAFVDLPTILGDRLGW